MGEESKNHLRSWREIAEQSVRESDPQKLTELIEELIRALDERMDSKSEPRDSQSSPSRPDTRFRECDGYLA
jgi:hypothetical protein